MTIVIAEMLLECMVMMLLVDMLVIIVLLVDMLVIIVLLVDMLVNGDHGDHGATG